MTYRDPTPLDPNINYTAEELATFIREKIYGQHTREAMARSLLKANEVAELSMIIAQDLIDGNFDETALNEEIERRLNDLETQYTPNLTSLENEVGNARGNEPTLGDRLNSVDQQLAQNDKEDSLIKLLHSHSGLKPNVIVKRAPSSTVKVGVFYNENKAVIYTLRPDGDGWRRLREVHAYEMKKVYVDGGKRLHKNFEAYTGGWDFNSEPQAFTLGEGNTFSGKFKGVGMKFISRTDNRGGLWEFEIDGTIKKKVSTWSATTASEVIHDVVAGLADGEHYYKATFLGEDPEGTYTEPARGWANYNSNYPTSSTYKTVFPIVKSYEEVDSGIAVMDSTSRKEFAFDVKRASTSYDTEWIPEHNVLGVMRNLDTKILLGGREVSILDEPDFYMEYPSVKFITKYKAYHPEDAVPIWDGRIDQTITPQGFHISGKMDFLEDTFIEIGYPGMLAINRDVTDNDAVVTSKGIRHLLNYQGSREDVFLSEIPSGVAHFSINSDTQIKKNLVMAIELYDIKRTLRLGQEGSGNNQVVQMRTDGLNKTYLRSHQNYTAKAGETYTFGATYFVCEIIDSADILP